MELQQIETTLERAVSLVNADPGLEVSRPVKHEKSGEVLLRKGEKLDLEALNRARSSGVQKFIVQQTDRRWIHPEEMERVFSGASLEDSFQLSANGEDVRDSPEHSRPYNKYLDILSSTTSPRVLEAIAQHTLPRDGDASSDRNDTSDSELHMELEELVGEYHAIQSGLNQLGEKTDREDGLGFLEGRLLGIEPLEMELSLPEEWLYRLQNFIHRREKLRRQLKGKIRDQREKERYLNEGRSLNAPIREASRLEHFTGALDRLEEGDRIGALDVLTRLVRESPEPTEHRVSRLDKMRRPLSAHGDDRDQILQKIFEETETERQRMDLLGLLGEEEPPPLDRMVNPPASPRLEKQINRYRLRDLRLEVRVHREIRRVYTQIYGDLNRGERDRLQSRLEEPFDREVPENLFPEGYLHRPKTGGGQTGGREQLDRFRNTPSRVLQASSLLGEEMVQGLVDTYKAPDDLDKWPREMLRRLEPVLLELLFPALVNMDRVAGLRKKIEEVLTSQPKPYQLLVQPPSPERYLLAHSYNVAVVSLLVGLELDLLPFQRLHLLLGALYLDSGMGVVPESLYLNGGELSTRGLEQVRRHPEFSRRLAARAVGPRHPVARIVHESHERIDGSGYPEGKSGRDLHPLTTILSAADVYTSLQEQRTHRDRHSPREALRIMVEHRDKYHPETLKTLVRTPGFYPNGIVVMLSDKRLGLVQRQDPLDPRRPYLLMLTDAEQNKLNDLEKLRLSEHPELHVVRCLRY